jgi:hydrogenase maturation protein HypF
MPPDIIHAPRLRVKVALRGAVQGVGFRPFIHRLATELGLAGWVNNSSQGVLLEVEGPRPALEAFLCRLPAEKPPLGFIQGTETTWLDAAGFSTFEIRTSNTLGHKTALVLPDSATCADCLQEILDPQNRRFRYPFTNCTHCGPRFSIIEALPYDRANTTMKHFVMCPACQSEYDNPRDRRFHAQPNACPVCGPQLEFWEDGQVQAQHEALRAAAAALRAGKILAVKGIGGFHLMVDARNDPAVRLLRERKHREEKPFALLFPTLDGIRQVCETSPAEERLLVSPAAPIVLLAKIGRRQGADGIRPAIGDAVAPHYPNLGIMLPSNPLHHLLLAELGFPVVATSGNVSDEPLCIDEHEALERLRGIADAFLVHNRPIVRQVDDSIVRLLLGREMVLRRARGYAPLPIQLRNEGVRDSAVCSVPGTPQPATILAVGAHLKNAVALAVGDNVFISQHIGDLETEPAEQAFRRVVADFQKLYEAPAEIVVADWHPDYRSTQFALEGRLPSRLGVERRGGETAPIAAVPGAGSPTAGPRVMQVQHHIAHVLSCIAENEIHLPALGVAWDGTGYGTDGTIWGGEFFLITAGAVERVATLRPFRLPGGAVAVKEPRRAALGLLFAMQGEAIFEQSDLPPVAAFSAAERSLLKTMLHRGFNSPLNSSMGRWFDAVAAILNLRQQMRFEGQAAMDLEGALAGVVTDKSYQLPLVTRDALCMLDWQPAMEDLLQDFRRGVPVGEIAAGFHNTLAEGIVAVARRFAPTRVALSGGCFQNRYLLERTVTRLRAEQFQPYWHQRVPTNDGGIALGQVLAAWRAQADGRV